MAFTLPNGVTVLNLPEQVEANVQDIADLNTKMDAVAADQQTSNTTSATAVATANTALETANTAKTTADEAKEMAEAVQGAIDTANTALSGANTAIESASAAYSAATTAQTTAETFYNDNKAVVEEAKSQLENISTTNDAAFGANVEVDGDLTLNSRDNIKLTETPTDTLALSSELTADYNALDTKIEANTTLIGTKLDTSTDDTFKKLFWGEIGRYRYDNAEIMDNDLRSFDAFSPYITNCTSMFSYVLMGETGTNTSDRVYYLPDFPSCSWYTYYLYRAQNRGTLNVGACKDDEMYGSRIFFNSSFDVIQPREGVTIKLSGAPYGYLYQPFGLCSNLTEVGAFDMSGAYQSMGDIFAGSSKLQHVHCTHFKVSFRISDSTQFEEDDLVEIIGNLDPVSTAQTLTMGSTNLAKLTTDEILVATGKGWTLA